MSGFSRTSRTLVVVWATLAAALAAQSVEQMSPGVRPAVALRASFDGLGVGVTAGAGTNSPALPRNPSDNSLAVGPNHVVQIVNSQLAIFTKQGQTVYGPVSTNAIFAGFGGVCAARPNGDAVVRYDQLAGRWLVVMPIFRRTVFDVDRLAPPPFPARRPSRRRRLRVRPRRRNRRKGRMRSATP